MPNVNGCLKRLVGKTSDEKKEEEQKAKEPQDVRSQPEQSTSGSSVYPYCESFEHLVSRDTDYTYLQHIVRQDLQRNRDEFDKSSKKIERLLAELSDLSLDARRRTWLQDDLKVELRRNESALSRVRLAEKENETSSVSEIGSRPEPSVRELEARKEHYEQKLRETEEALKRLNRQ